MTQAAPAPAPDEEGWQKLDVRMLLLDPVKTLAQFFIPLLIGLIGLRNSGTWPLWALPLAILAPITLGSLPWLTTRYRITTTQFQMRTGLLNKKQLTAPLDRIRSVDLEATVLHRLLGLSKVEIGTGVDDTRITLDSLSVPQADELRGVLLARRAPPAIPPSTPASRAGAADRRPAARARRGARPHRLVLAAVRAVQPLAAGRGRRRHRRALPVRRRPAVPNRDNLEHTWEWVAHFALALVVVVALVVGLVIWVLISVTGYVVQWWNLLLVREHGHVRLTAGLLTTRSTTVEDARIRGVALSEPVLLRLVGGGELATLATGVGEGGVTTVLPPCPVTVATGVGHTLLAEDGALSMDLVAHGPIARRRCHVRMQWPTLVLTVAAVVAVVAFDDPRLGAGAGGARRRRPGGRRPPRRSTPISATASPRATWSPARAPGSVAARRSSVRA